MRQLFQRIDKNRELYIRWLQEACRQPSIAIQNRGMKEMAEMVKAYLQGIGAKVELVNTSGYPVVYGEIFTHKKKTLSFYNHYDVQPEGMVNSWKMDPFAAEIQDGKMYGRGVADNKGNLVARICAIHAYKEILGELPVNVKFIIEGEEEISSPHLEEFARKHPEKVQSDGVIWEGGLKDNAGRLHVGLGVKGTCYVELRINGANTEIHSSEAPIFVNPAWRLVWALNTLKDHQEKILIEGFYDCVKELNDEEKRSYQEISYDEEGRLKHLGLPQFLRGVTGEALKESLYCQPTCTICGIESGYMGEGPKTVIPNSAKAKVDFRLVPYQDPDEILKLLRKHLDKHGFEDIEIVPLMRLFPFQTNSDDPLVQTIINQVENVYGQSPIIIQNYPGSSPMHVLCRQFNIPAVHIGVGNQNSNYHAPNENIYIQDFIDGIKMTAIVLHEFANV